MRANIKGASEGCGVIWNVEVSLFPMHESRSAEMYQRYKVASPPCEVELWVPCSVSTARTDPRLIVLRAYVVSDIVQ